VQWREHLEPRDPVVASRWAAVLTSLAALVTTVFAVVNPPPVGIAARLLTYLVPPVLVGVVVLLRRAPKRWLVVMWLPLPLAGIAAIAGLDLATYDASAAGQVFFCYPVIYAASQLRARQAAFCATVAVVADAIVALSLQPLTVALTNIVYVGTTLVTLTILLVRATDGQERLVAQLQRQAAVDTLTGLVTRRVLDDAAQSVLAAADATSGTALLLLDIDHFKDVNDTYGHPVGDQALVHVAGLLAAATRPGTVICRIGGDEIALLLPSCLPDVATARAEALIAAVQAAPLTLADGTVVALSVSLGVGHAGTGEHKLRDLYASADRSLYEAKRAGRGRVGDLINQAA
jgi:diguanylate cyclase (GGDEF)-like protein